MFSLFFFRIIESYVAVGFFSKDASLPIQVLKGLTNLYFPLHNIQFEALNIGLNHFNLDGLTVLVIFQVLEPMTV